MSVAKKFQLLGHGNGWPNLRLGESVSVRPYVAASASSAGTGYERFITLGGYSNANSGPPTKEQLNLSLANAMKIFYNIESSCSGNASASASPSGVSAVSATSNLSNANYINGTRADLGAKLTPRERVMLSIKGEHDGAGLPVVNSLVTEVDSDAESISGISIGAGTSVSFTRKIVRMFDNGVFLGYGISTPNYKVTASSQFQSDSASCGAGVGSYFNRPVPSEPEFSDDKFSAINSTKDGMPMIASSFASAFTDGSGGSASASGSSASATSGDCQVSAKVSGNSSFYTYN